MFALTTSEGEKMRKAPPMPAWMRNEQVSADGEVGISCKVKPKQPSEKLTKREQFCLAIGVADTGDKELDAIITKGNKQKAAIAAMQGLLANETAITKSTLKNIGNVAAAFAENLLEAMERTK